MSVKIANELAFLACANETSKREEAEKNVSHLKRENDDLKRANKLDKNKKQNDVRLQRALEEVESTNLRIYWSKKLMVKKEIRTTNTFVC